MVFYFCFLFPHNIFYGTMKWFYLMIMVDQTLYAWIHFIFILIVGPVSSQVPLPQWDWIMWFLSMCFSTANLFSNRSSMNGQNLYQQGSCEKMALYPSSKIISPPLFIVFCFRIWSFLNRQAPSCFLPYIIDNQCLSPF